MSHDNTGNYPEPPNQGYVIPNDAEGMPGTHAGVADTVLTGEEAVAALATYAVELLTSNNVFIPTTKEFETSGVESGASVVRSLYETVIHDSPVHNEGNYNLLDAFQLFKGIGSQVNDALKSVFLDSTDIYTGTPLGANTDTGINSNEIFSPAGSQEKITKPGTQAIQEFVNSIIRDSAKRQNLKLSQSPLLEESKDVTTNAKYKNSLKQGASNAGKGIGAENVYSADRDFTTVVEGGGASLTTNWAELSDVVRSQLQAAIAVIGGGEFSADISDASDNAVTNFFAGIAREFARNPTKLLKFETSQIALRLLNPSIVNADDVGGGAFTLQRGISLLADAFGIGDKSKDNSDGPLRGSVESIYRRSGPSILSLIPDFAAFNLGKGRLYNPLALAGGAALSFGEQLIPGTAIALDSVGSSTEGTLIASVLGIESLAGSFEALPVFNRTAELRDKENLEPYSIIAKLENPQHLGGEKGKRVLSRIGKNRWQLKNLPDAAILRAGFDPTANDDGSVKPYTNDTVLDRESVKKLEEQLDQEYVPFYFHDMRTNEIVAFHAFLRSYSETYTPSWTATQYYGRVDPVQIYGGQTVRSINIAFTIVALNRIDFDIMWKKVNKLTTLVYPQFGEPITTIDGEQVPFSEPLRGAPIIRLRLGDVIKTNYSEDASYVDSIRAKADENAIATNARIDAAAAAGQNESVTQAQRNLVEKQRASKTPIEKLIIDFKKSFGKGLPGVINNLTYDYAKSVWETAYGHVAPQMIEVNFAFTAIHDIAPGLDRDGVNRAPLYTPVRKNIFANSQGLGTLDSTMRDKG